MESSDQDKELFYSICFYGKYFHEVHSCVSISNGMRHSNDYDDMDMLNLLSISHIGDEIEMLEHSKISRAVKCDG